MAEKKKVTTRRSAAVLNFLQGDRIIIDVQVVLKVGPALQLPWRNG